MNTFAELPLDPALLKAVTEMGYEKPSPIQAQALPVLLGEPTDFIGLAATGTGKTAAFSLPLLQRIDPEAKGVQAIILCPTRELCLQVAGQVDKFGKGKGIQSLAIYGGAGYDEQLRRLRQGVSVIVGTPGRVIDHMERGTLKLGAVKTVVLDEADEMISMGFREAMETILSEIPKESSNTWLFSATMSTAVRHVVDEFLNEPKKVQVNRTEMLSSGVEQICYFTHEKNKPEVICKLIDAADDFYGIIFCQTKSLVMDLTNYLMERGYKVDSLHGDMSQMAREQSMNAFRRRAKRIMVCTDVAARGLDVQDITHVINYSLPRELDNYVHRIGRTARSGKTGFAMSLVTPSHRYLLNKIEAMTKSRFVEGKIPTRKEIGMKKIAQKLGEFTGVANVERAQSLLDQTWKDALSNMTSEEVAARFLSVMYPWVFIEDARPPEMERKAPLKEPRPRDVARNERWKAERGGTERVKQFAENRRDQKAAFNREDKPRNDEGRGWKPKFDRQAARKDRAAKFQAGGDKRKFSDGPFAKFGKRKSSADLPPRRRP